MQHLWKIALSLFIIYHCLIVFLYPNRISYLNVFIQPYTLAYANLVGLNTPWQFFSPDPGPALYLKSYIFKDDKQIAEHLFPDEKDVYFFRSMFNRKTAAARFLIKSKDRAERIFIPWLCSLYPEATSISVHQRIVKVVSLADVRGGEELNQMNEGMDKYFVTDDCTKVSNFKDFINEDSGDVFEDERSF